MKMQIQRKGALIMEFPMTLWSKYRIVLEDTRHPQNICSLTSQKNDFPRTIPLGGKCMGKTKLNASRVQNGCLERIITPLINDN
jgi:hypothetical protein